MPLLGHGKEVETQIEDVGTVGHNSKYDEVSQPHQGVQGQVDVPQVPLLGHGSEIETPNWACREYRTRKGKS